MNTHTRYMNYLLKWSVHICCYINETYNEIELKLPELTFRVNITDIYISNS